MQLDMVAQPEGAGGHRGRATDLRPARAFGSLLTYKIFDADGRVAVLGEAKRDNAMLTKPRTPSVGRRGTGERMMGPLGGSLGDLPAGLYGYHSAGCATSCMRCPLVPPEI